MAFVNLYLNQSYATTFLILSNGLCLLLSKCIFKLYFLVCLHGYILLSTFMGIQPKGSKQPFPIAKNKNAAHTKSST